MARNKKWSASTKLEIVLQALKGEKTLNEICKKHEVAPSQVLAWKKQLVEQGEQLFSKSEKSTTMKVNHEKVISQLYEKIGQLTVERDFLKKSWSKFPGSKGDN